MNPQHLEAKWRGVLATLDPKLSPVEERMYRAVFFAGAAALWSVMHGKLDLSTHETTRHDEQLFNDLMHELIDVAGETHGQSNSH